MAKKKADVDSVDEVNTVEEVYEYEEQVEEKVEESHVAPIRAGDLFARKPERGVTIMTESASMAADESAKKLNPAHKINRFTQKIRTDR